MNLSTCFSGQGSSAGTQKSHSDPGAPEAPVLWGVARSLVRGGCKPLQCDFNKESGVAGLFPDIPANSCT